MDSEAQYPLAVRLAQTAHSAFTAWVILAVSLLLTVGAYLLSERFVQKRGEDRFLFRAQELEEAINTRIHLYEQLLWSGAALMNASTQVNREDFKHFVSTIDIARRWPGIQGYGYSVVVRPQQRQSHIDTIRAEGFPDYTIKPEGERDLYSAIIYLEPFDWRNQRAFGYDMYSNPIRRAAMERARDTGQAATSGLITLVQETKDDVQTGFLIYVPVYATHTVPPTLEQRRTQLRGWIYAPFRMGNLMHGILGEREKDIQFEIFDGDVITADSLLYSSRGRSFVDSQQHRPVFTKSVQLNLQGRPWILNMSTTEDIDEYDTQGLPRYVALGGIIIDLLLFYVIFSLHFVNRRAEALAENKSIELEQARQSLEQDIQQRTAELQQARISLEEAVQERTQQLEEKLHELETLTRVTVGREERVLALKTQVNELSIQLGTKPPYESVQ